MLTNNGIVTAWVFDISRRFLKSYHVMLQTDTDCVGRDRTLLYDRKSGFGFGTHRIDACDENCVFWSNMDRHLILWTKLTSNVTYNEVLEEFIDILEKTVNELAKETTRYEEESNHLKQAILQLREDQIYARGGLNEPVN